MTLWAFANNNPFTAALMVMIVACAIVEVISEGFKAWHRRLWLKNVERHGWPHTVYVDEDGQPLERPEIEPVRNAQTA